MAQMFYAQDCNLEYLMGKKRLPSSATALRDTRTRSTCVTPAAT